MRLLICFSLILAVSAFAGAVGSPREAADLVLEKILDGSYEGKQLLTAPMLLEEGMMIPSWHRSVEVPFQSYLVLVDDMALANWEHPCRWVFVSQSGETEVVDMTTPPHGIDRMTVEYSDLPVPEASEETMTQRERFLEWFTPNPRPNRAPENCFALLISGGYNSSNNHTRYYGDTQFFYETITQDYSYPEDNVVVCFADGTDPAPDNSQGENSNPDLDDDGDTDFNYDATFSGVSSGFDDILSMTGPDDYLVIMTTDHGGSGKGGVNEPPEVYLNLWNTETLDDDTLDKWIDQLDCIALHVIMEQCYSGGFLEEVVPTTGNQDRSFASAANGSESSWAGGTYDDYDEWIYWWIGAMHGSVPPGGSYPGGDLPWDPDTDGDGYVNFGEAFDASLAWDSCAVSGQEHPQYDDDPDSCGDLYYLGGEIPGPGVGETSGPIHMTRPLGVAPNPVTATLSASFGLASGCSAELAVYDVAGRLVHTMSSGHLEAGEHLFTWDTSTAPAGVYLVTLRAADEMQAVRVVRL
ncbi:T9SS type A sorting domain-containing protein [Candidatus Fermentibacteria bacterium]|nr:T9SS type A sorting domain-containing protein [Candidatus Fermentibacteria bacterium]